MLSKYSLDDNLYVWKIISNSQFVQEDREYFETPTPPYINKLKTEIVRGWQQNPDLLKKDYRFIDYQKLADKFREFFEKITSAFKSPKLLIAKNFNNLQDWVELESNIQGTAEYTTQLLFTYLDEDILSVGEPPPPTVNQLTNSQRYEYQNWLTNQYPTPDWTPKQVRDWIAQTAGVSILEFPNVFASTSFIGAIITPNADLYSAPILTVSTDLYLNTILKSPYDSLGLDLLATPAPFPIRDMATYLTSLPSNQKYLFSDDITVGFGLQK
jgi:hypothetical protein